MRPLAFAMIVLGASSLFTLAQAQDRSAELDNAVEEAKAASFALQEAEKRRDAGVEAQEGERIGTVGGSARQTDEYWQRQEQLEREVAAARERYEAAQKRWNDLK